MKKKLQVFISSTYEDLRTERQAAVEATLSAGHIPAGMELFAAGDESQLEVIKRWIDESDVFLLILGERYGSIEPTSRKSYIEIEYRYAVECGKSFFAIVYKPEEKNTASAQGEDYMAFREYVCSKTVRFWEDAKDIRLSIYETLATFSRRDLSGWIRGNQVPTEEYMQSLHREIERLNKEKEQLRSENIISEEKARLSEAGHMTWGEYTSRTEMIADRIWQAIQRPTFFVDAILGISDGGMIVADLIGKFLSSKCRVPVVGMWAQRYQRADHEPIQIFANTYNDAMLQNIRDVHARSETARGICVIIVDHRIVTGKTACQAIEYVKSTLGNDCEVIVEPLLCANPSILRKELGDYLPFAGRDINGDHVYDLKKDAYYEELKPKAKYLPYQDSPIASHRFTDST